MGGCPVPNPFAAGCTKVSTAAEWFVEAAGGVFVVGTGVVPALAEAATGFVVIDLVDACFTTATALAFGVVCVGLAEAAAGFFLTSGLIATCFRAAASTLRVRVCASGAALLVATGFGVLGLAGLADGISLEGDLLDGSALEALFAGDTAGRRRAELGCGFSRFERWRCVDLAMANPRAPEPHIFHSVVIPVNARLFKWLRLQVKSVGTRPTPFSR